MSMHLLGWQQRLATGMIALVALVVNLGLATGFHAPRRLVDFLAFSAGGIVVASLVTAVWRISLHTAVVASLLGAAGAQCGLSVLAGLPVAVVMGWARVRVRAHTPVQVVLGCSAGLAWAAFYCAVWG
ncbi:hypothetical protein [Streptomyces triculaminicus]|uniref:hypothetical protein n=1 Tax=Streptomyces triculaminicus TaxID=2816232 RepID=UPI0037CF4A42